MGRSCIIGEDKRPPPNKYLYSVFCLVLHEKDRHFARVFWMKSPGVCAKCTIGGNSRKSVSAVLSFITLEWAGSTIAVVHASNEIIIVYVSQQSCNLCRCRCDSID